MLMENTTLTSDTSAIQIKLMYLHFKSVKINDDMNRINSLKFKDKESPEAISAKGEIAFNMIDVIALFEGYNTLVKDINAYPNFSKRLNKALANSLKEIRKRTEKWKHVRNKIGGHVDIESIKSFCETYNYRGVFLSDELEADFKGITMLQIIESAINSTLHKSKLLISKAKLTTQYGLNIVVDKIMEDWKLCFDLNQPLMELLYEIGKEEKLNSTNPDDIGIIKFKE